MTTSEALLTLIGKRATIREGSLEIQITILDVKNAYGVDRVLITPEAGKGQTWVNITRITLERESQ